MFLEMSFHQCFVGNFLQQQRHHWFTAKFRQAIVHSHTFYGKLHLLVRTFSGIRNCEKYKQGGMTYMFI